MISPSGAPRRRILRIWSSVTVLALAWLVLAFALVPRVIRQAYEGRSLAPLNRLISGQADHGVDEYLAVWSGLAWRLTLGLAIAVVVVTLVVRFRRPLGSWITRVVLGPSARGLGPVGILGLAVGIGAATGLLEAVGAIVHQMIVPKPNWMYRPDVLWAAPAVNGVVMLLIAGPTALVLVVLRRRMPLRPLAFAFVAVGVYAALRGWAVGLLPYAAAFLGAGLAVVTVRRLERVGGERLGLVVGGLALFVGLLAVAIPLMHRAGERLALRRAPGSVSTQSNVLLLILDTVRARELSLYGYPEETAPRIAELAERGVAFRRAEAPSSWTLPSHASMFTGLPATRLAADWDVRLEDDVPTLSEVLANAGYATAGFVANYHYTGTATGLARGFHHYTDHLHTVEFTLRNSYLGRKIDSWRRRITHNHQLLDRLDATDINAAFLAWLPRRGRRPFFAFLNYYDAHDPYLPPKAPTWWSDSVPPVFWIEPHTHTDSELRQLQHSYDEAIKYLDTGIGTLLDSLRTLGVLDSTIVIVTADHGELFGERDRRLLLHGNSLYHASLHVPLVVAFPDASGAGTWIEAPVSMTDLAATLLDFLDLDGPLPGESFAGLIRQPEATSAEGDRPILSEVRPYRSPRPWEPIARGRMASVRLGSLHYIRNGDGSEELYDVEADPWEVRDLQNDPARIPDLAVLRSALDSLLEVHVR